MLDVSMTITGLQEAQDRNLRAIMALRPGGAVDEAVRMVTVGLHRHMTSIVHVDTGAYRASNRIRLIDGRGEIFPDPGAVNPRSGIRVAEYAPDEEARGGSHAAYRRTVQEAGPALLKQGVLQIGRAIGW